MNEQKKTSGYFDAKPVALFVLGLIIGSALTYSFANKGFISVNSASSDENDISTTTSSYLIKVEDQISGSKVLISSVEVVDVSWVAIRENNGEVMGRILGAQKVLTGKQENISVDLLRPTAPQVMYAAVIYKDNGDGEFDFKVDELVTESELPVLSRFTTN
jgi:hypothetical protein